MNKLRHASTLTGKVVIVIAAVLGGGALVSSSAFAALSAVATGSNTVESGKLLLQQASSSVAGITGGITSNISLIASGDTVNRYIDLTRAGNLDGQTPTLTLTAGSSALTNQADRGLHIAIKQCEDGAYNASGACLTSGGAAGTERSVLADTSVYTLTSTTPALNLASTIAGATSHLKVIYTVVGDEVSVNGVLPTGVDAYNPSFSGTTIQGVAATTITWSFREALRTDGGASTGLTING